MESKIELFVSKNAGDFNTIAKAIDAIPKDCSLPIVIKVASGIYEESVVLPHSYLSLIGEDANTTFIRYGRYAKERMEDGSLLGTFLTATVRTDGNHILLKNLTIENTAGNGRDYGQAIALYAEGNPLTVASCRLLGHQDTLFTAPLPPVNKYGFNSGFGPKQKEERSRGKHLYYNSYIEGDIDFIFGGAMALFFKCTVFSHNTIVEGEAQDIKGYVTAPCTPVDQKYGYLFYRCQLLSDCRENSVYLGRPWREYAKSVFIKCFMDRHIKSEGFHDWDNVNARLHSFFAEGKNRGGGSEGKRNSWCHKLSGEESKEYLKRFMNELRITKK